MPDHAIQPSESLFDDRDDWLEAAGETVDAWRAWEYADTNPKMRKARIRLEASIAALDRLIDPDGELAAEAKAQALEP